MGELSIIRSGWVLELLDEKLSRAVLRGAWGGDAPTLTRQARYYAPHIGRFLQPDPIISGSNLYAYVNNDSLNATDPSGMLLLTTSSEHPYMGETLQRLRSKIGPIINAIETSPTAVFLVDSPLRTETQPISGPRHIYPFWGTQYQVEDYFDGTGELLPPSVGHGTGLSTPVVIFFNPNSSNVRGGGLEEALAHELMHAYLAINGINPKQYTHVNPGETPASERGPMIIENIVRILNGLEPSPYEPEETKKWKRCI